MNKTFNVILIVAVCVLFFVSFRQHKEIQTMRRSVSYLDSRIDKLESTCNELRDKCNSLAAEMSDARSSIENLDTDMDNAYSHINSTRADMAYYESLRALYGR